MPPRSKCRGTGRRGQREIVGTAARGVEDPRGRFSAVVDAQLGGDLGACRIRPTVVRRDVGQRQVDESEVVASLLRFHLRPQEVDH